MKVLFICRANAARSQMAEAFYNEQTGTEDAFSAGVDLQNSVKGDDPTVPDDVIEVMQEVGIEVAHKRRDTLTPHMIDTADKVIVISDYPMPEYVEQSQKVEKWLDIPDPVRQPIEMYRVARDAVRDRVRKLISSSDSYA